MKKLASLLVVALFALASMSAHAAEKTLHHVVALKFKSDAKADEIKKVEAAFQELKTKIPGITSLEWGTNVSPENKNKGFTHCFLLAFKSDKDRDAYLVHPDHKAFGKLLHPIIDDVFVIDFWSQE